MVVAGLFLGQAVSLIASLVVSLPCTAHSIAARENPNLFKLLSGANNFKMNDIKTLRQTHSNFFEEVWRQYYFIRFVFLY
jgi:hypothetical protein